MKQKLKKDISIHFCSFNATNHEQVEKGAKGLLPDNIAMIGKELCGLLGLNYDKIIEERKEHQKENFDYFCWELANIPKVKLKILKAKIKKDLTQF